MHMYASIRSVIRLFEFNHDLLLTQIHTDNQIALRHHVLCSASAIRVFIAISNANLRLFSHIKCKNKSANKIIIVKTAKRLRKCQRWLRVNTGQIVGGRFVFHTTNLMETFHNLI